MVCVMTFVVSLVPTADAQPPIKVGQISAWDYPGGQEVKRGVQMAIRDINAAGGLLGGKVESILTNAMWMRLRKQLSDFSIKIRWMPFSGFGEATWQSYVSH